MDGFDVADRNTDFCSPDQRVTACRHAGVTAHTSMKSRVALCMTALPQPWSRRTIITHHGSSSIIMNHPWSSLTLVISRIFGLDGLVPSRSWLELAQSIQHPKDIVKGTSQWKGIRVTVKLTIQTLGRGWPALPPVGPRRLVYHQTQGLIMYWRHIAMVNHGLYKQWVYIWIWLWLLGQY